MCILSANLLLFQACVDQSLQLFVTTQLMKHAPSTYSKPFQVWKYENKQQHQHLLLNLTKLIANTDLLSYNRPFNFVSFSTGNVMDVCTLGHKLDPSIQTSLTFLQNFPTLQMVLFPNVILQIHIS